MSRGEVDTGRSYQKWWILVATLLIIAIIAGGVVFGLRQWDRDESVEITLSSIPTSTLEVYLSGAIANGGIYTFSQDSSLGDVIQGAGGVNENADLTSIKIHIPIVGENSLVQPQKVNINKAEAWLLEALDGIGPTLAQRIIEYRENNGPFNSIDELTDVFGIGPKTLEDIRDKISIID